MQQKSCEVKYYNYSNIHTVSVKGILEPADKEYLVHQWKVTHH